MRRALLTVAVSLGLLVPAVAAEAAPSCTGGAPAAGTSITCTPNGSGFAEFTIPAGVGSISIVADGGGGGKNDALSNGGSGARVSMSITAIPGQKLRIYAGAGGGAGVGGAANTGGAGFGTGGNGGPYYGEGFGGGYGGGGGGSSAVQLAGVTVLVAGGGGGGGGNAFGGSSTQDGAVGGGDGACARGGTGGHGGTAGTTSGTGVTTAATGSFAGRGGSGTYGAGGASSGGGGGGAGYGGGGAGNWNGPYGCSNAGGGGAGGSYASVAATFGSANNAGLRTSGAGNGGDGQVVVSFVAAPPTVPDAPTDLLFTNISDTQISAYWTPPANDGGSPVLRYWVSVDGGTAVSASSPMYTATPLTANTSHTFSVTAETVAGSSAALTRAQSTAATPPPTTVPDAPTNMTFSSITSSSIQVSWVAPGNTGGQPITDYQFQIDGGPLSVCTPYSPCQGSPFTVTGLLPNSTHTFSVYARNVNGSSLPLSGTATTIALDPPDSPTSLEFSAVTHSTITASWTAPASPGGSAITGYEVIVDDGAPITVATTTMTATGLEPATWHSFEITAVNADGPSPELTGARSTTAVPTPNVEPSTEPSPEPSASPSANSPVETPTQMKRAPTVAGVSLPKKLKLPGRTVLVKRALVTDEGTPVTASVVVKPGKRSVARVLQKKSGKVILIAKKASVKSVTLRLHAVATSAANEYVFTKRWSG